MLNHKLLNCACFLLFLGLVSAIDPVLLKHVNQQNLDGAGQYKHEIEVDNGIKTSAQGNVNGIQGEYFLPAEDGQPPVRVTYTADSTGFHPHIN
ncbi:pupal cuticle protein Edg-78E [Drosophila grimshawi]|uniref:GH21573 n=1 Tax=Drosophila grimshawi TaxID=7222 RepID=B4J4W7_DROGR|nr:pupal cuticle protein Edg-78E [Drosophila grimshawi]EDW01673.1 GH21573 [Drosophila grimshawi]